MTSAKVTAELHYSLQKQRGRNSSSTSTNALFYLLHLNEEHLEHTGGYRRTEAQYSALGAHYSGKVADGSPHHPGKASANERHKKHI